MSGSPPWLSKHFPPARDVLLCAALALWTIVYLTFAWPRDFYNYDEGVFLYEAKRILEGQVIYRDFFELVTPGAWYVMALLFWLFGISMDTARIGMAVIHALITVMVFAICRRLGLPRGLGVATALAHVAVCYPALSIASPHWFSTGITLLLMLVALAPRGAASTPRAALIGVVTGAFIAVQQQKGVMAAAAGALIIFLDALTNSSRLWRSCLPLLGRYAAGIAVVVVPLFAVLFVTAGWEPVFDALVLHPLRQYAPYNRTSWGSYSHRASLWYVLPELIARLPFVIPVVALRWLWAALRGHDAGRVRSLLVLWLIGSAAVAGILYFPNYTHLAMVAPIMMILVADTAHAMLSFAMRHLRLPARAPGVAACLLCVALVAQSDHNRRVRNQLFPFRHETAFGRIDFRHEIEARLVDALRAHLERSPSREIFVYTSYPGLYLTAAAENPTPFQLLIPGYNPPEQFQQVIDILEERQVQWIVAMRTSIKRRVVYDPVWTYISHFYEPVPFWPRPQLIYGVFRRKDPAERSPMGQTF